MSNGLHAWMDQAACRGYDPEWWFADSSKPTDRDDAMKICQHCTVKTECAVLGTQYTDGIWGGLTPQQRTRTRKAI